MSSQSDTNQASEDDLRESIDALLERWRNILTYKGDGNGDECYQSEVVDDIQEIIRTEKLKLLAEVRERVVGENQHSEHKEWDCPCGVTHSFTEEWHATNRLRDEQRTALTKLEANQ